MFPRGEGFRARGVLFNEFIFERRERAHSETWIFGGALGILFPPSINLVIFSIATTGMQATGPHGEAVPTASVGDLFIAGVVPGLVLALLLGITTWYRAKKYDYPRMPRATWLERWKAFREASRSLRWKRK